MKYRKLRIAWSVAWGIVAVLLVALWIRSYWQCELLSVPIAHAEFGSFYGGLQIESLNSEGGTAQGGWVEWSHGPVIDIEKDMQKLGLSLSATDILFDFYHFHNKIGTPLWLPILICVVLSISPTCPWWSKRFSLRTLLIATTLVAIGLGLIVWAMH